MRNQYFDTDDFVLETLGDKTFRRYEKAGHDHYRFLFHDPLSRETPYFYQKERYEAYQLHDVDHLNPLFKALYDHYQYGFVPKLYPRRRRMHTHEYLYSVDWSHQESHAPNEQDNFQAVVTMPLAMQRQIGKHFYPALIARMATDRHVFDEPPSNFMFHLDLPYATDIQRIFELPPHTLSPLLSNVSSSDLEKRINLSYEPGLGLCLYFSGGKYIRHFHSDIRCHLLSRANSIPSSIPAHELFPAKSLKA